MSDGSESMPKIGIWRAVGGLANYRLIDVLWPEGIPALLIGGGGSVLVVRATKITARAAAVASLVGLSAALLAVVFAALAILVALPASRYLTALAATKPDESPGGFQRFLNPYLLAVGTQVSILLLAIAYGLVASRLPAHVEHAVFYVVSFLFVYGLLDIAGLARSLVRHGVFRSTEGSSDATGSSDVHHLSDRRGGAAS
jgi:small-conductance mechanosensitive channel